MRRYYGEWMVRLGVAGVCIFGAPLLGDQFPERVHMISWVGGFVCALALSGYRRALPRNSHATNETSVNKTQIDG